MDGTISVRAMASGVEASLSFDCPGSTRRRRTQRSRIAPRRLDARLESRRVVIVHDDSAISVAMVLEAGGHEVRTATTGQAGIQQIAAFDLRGLLLAWMPYHDVSTFGPTEMYAARTK